MEVDSRLSAAIRSTLKGTKVIFPLNQLTVELELRRSGFAGYNCVPLTRALN